MFRLAHVSDIHLSPLPNLRKRDFATKRITGYLNWRFNRKHIHGIDALTPSVLRDALVRYFPLDRSTVVTLVPATAAAK